MVVRGLDGAGPALKFLMVVLSGVADLPSAALKGRTPLEAARTPALDELAAGGRVGTVALLGPQAGDAPAGSDAALLTLLGYDTDEHPLRRGPLEAAGAGITLAPDDLALRGNLVTIDQERIVDLTAGRISTDEAALLLADLARAAGSGELCLHPLSRYRFLVVVPGGRTLALATAPPHAALGRPVREVYPAGEDAPRIGRLIDLSREILKVHEVNRVRVDLGENPANAVWLWGEGADLELPSFASCHGVRGGAVAGAALARGIARKAGFELKDVPGANGDLDTDLDAKARAALELLRDFDFVFVHVQGANEASHLKDPLRKRDFIAELDRRLVAPLLEQARAAPDLRLMVASDHVTATESDAPALGSSPFLIHGDGFAGVRQYPFDEAHALRSDLQIEDGRALMEFFLGHRG